MKKNILKQTLFIIIIILSSSVLLANPKLEITGQVKDNNTKEALVFCTVSVYNLQDSLVMGAVTNDNGFFTLPLFRDNYKIIISYVGYISDTINITVNEDKFLGIIKLKPNEITLDGVTVEASTHQHQLDREVQLITKHLRTGAANTSDVLDKIQGITYDRYNNSIKVDGESNIIILVNGLEKDQEYIRNLNPERLKEIEIIRDPSGRYAVEGYSAVINVILKDNYKGSEIFVQNMALIDLDASKPEYIMVLNNASVTYNYTYNKLNFYTKIRNRYNDFNLQTTNTHEFNNGLSIKKTFLENNFNTKIFHLSNNYTFGFDYYINPKHTISIESNITALPMKTSIFQSNYENTNYDNEVEIANYTSQSKNLSRTQNILNSIFYIYKINQNNTLNADFTYSNYRGELNNTYSESTSYKRNEFGTNLKDYTKFFVEFEHLFKNNFGITVGYGNTWKRLDNNIFYETTNIDALDILRDTSNFIFTDSRHQFYAYYSWKITKKIAVKLGAIAENSNPKSEDLKTSYIIYQPYGDLKFDIHKFFNIKFKYRSYSDYPSIEQVTPFIHVIDQYAIQKGNPTLNPAVTHNLSLKLNVMQGLLSVEPYYNFSKNKINTVVQTGDNDILEYTYGNVGNYTHKGIKGNLMIPLFKRSLIIQTDANFFVSSMLYNEKENTFNDWTMNAQLIYINKKYETVAGLIYQKNLRKYITAQGYTAGNNDFWMLFVQQPLFKKKLSIMLGYMLPINFAVKYGQGNYTETDFYTSQQIYDTSILTNIIMFRISYRFNNGKIVKKSEKDIKKEVEQSGNSIF